MVKSWGSLNPALTAWRQGILERFPDRGNASDGGLADGAHSASSQHQKDADGTVDAFDCDVNWLGSSIPAGNAREQAISAAVKADFERDPRAQLWIHNRAISNRDIGPWRDRAYDGPSPHTLHIHFEARQALEKDGRPWAMPLTDALLGRYPVEVTSFTTSARDVLKAEATEGSVGYKGGGLPTWPGAPAGRNFLNCFKQLFDMVAAQSDKIDALQADVAKLVEQHQEPEEPPVTTATGRAPAVVKK